MKSKDIRIAVRVTQREKDRITNLAGRCGLSTTEYLRQRALGHEPKSVPPDALFRFCEKLDALVETPFSEEANHRILARPRTAKRGFGLRREPGQNHTQLRRKGQVGDREP